MHLINLVLLILIQGYSAASFVPIISREAARRASSITMKSDQGPMVTPVQFPTEPITGLKPLRILEHVLPVASCACTGKGPYTRLAYDWTRRNLERILENKEGEKLLQAFKDDLVDFFYVPRWYRFYPLLLDMSPYSNDVIEAYFKSGAFDRMNRDGFIPRLFEDFVKSAVERSNYKAALIGLRHMISLIPSDRVSNVSDVSEYLPNPELFQQYLMNDLAGLEEANFQNLPQKTRDVFEFYIFWNKIDQKKPFNHPHLTKYSCVIPDAANWTEQNYDRILEGKDRTNLLKAFDDGLLNFFYVPRMDQFYHKLLEMSPESNEIIKAYFESGAFDQMNRDGVFEFKYFFFKAVIEKNYKAAIIGLRHVISLISSGSVSNVYEYLPSPQFIRRFFMMHLAGFNEDCFENLPEETRDILKFYKLWNKIDRKEPFNHPYLTKYINDNGCVIPGASLPLGDLKEKHQTQVAPKVQLDSAMSVASFCFTGKVWSTKEAANWTKQNYYRILSRKEIENLLKAFKAGLLDLFYVPMDRFYLILLDMSPQSDGIIQAYFESGAFDQMNRDGVIKFDDFVKSAVVRRNYKAALIGLKHMIGLIPSDHVSDVSEHLPNPESFQKFLKFELVGLEEANIQNLSEKDRNILEFYKLWNKIDQKKPFNHPYLTKYINDNSSVIQDPLVPLGDVKEKPQTQVVPEAQVAPKVQPDSALTKTEALNNILKKQREWTESNLSGVLNSLNKDSLKQAYESGLIDFYQVPAVDNLCEKLLDMAPESHSVIVEYFTSGTFNRMSKFGIFDYADFILAAVQRKDYVMAKFALDQYFSNMSMPELVTFADHFPIRALYENFGKRHLDELKGKVNYAKLTDNEKRMVEFYNALNSESEN